MLFFAKTSQRATLGLLQDVNITLRSNIRKHSALNKNLGVFESYFGVFEKDGKIMFGYCNTMRFYVD